MRSLYIAFAKKFEIPNDEADLFSDMLVQADLRGLDGQGLMLFNIHYISKIRDGRIKPGSKISIVKETPSMILLDGGCGLGQVVGTRAMELAIKKAKRSGVCVVSIRNTNDWGMTAYYTMKALNHDCIGIALANASPQVAPWGGIDGIFGTNPLSIAIPAGKHFPIILDMATSAASGAMIMKAFVYGEAIPEGLILDKMGLATKKPFAYKEKTHLSLGYKGFGLTLVVDLLSGALSGMSCAKDVNTMRGQFCMAIDIDQFTPIEEFKSKVDRVIDQAKSSRLAEGFTEILMPGEKEFREEQKRLSEGIPVHEKVWEEIIELSEELDINWEMAINI